MSKPEFMYEIWIGATPDAIWEAITQPEFTRRYFHGMAIESEWVPGSPLTFRYPDGRAGVEGVIVEAVRPRRLVYTWRFVFDRELAAEAASTVAWEIAEEGPACRLRVTHTGFSPDSRTLPMITEGWSPILCSLKSLLETGEPLAGVPSETAA